MRIARLCLDNFRCFERADLDLSGDVVAIYGRNGVGKTAVFDAIELALLGSLGRFDNSQELPDWVSHVQTNGDPRVRLEFDGADQLWIEASCTRGTPRLVQLATSGAWRHHREFLYDRMIHDAYAPPRRQVDTVAELFRATMLLSQDSMRRFVEGNRQERARILSYIAGSAYLQKCTDKAVAVGADARRETSRLQQAKDAAISRLNELEVLIAERESRLQSLNSTSPADTSYEEVRQGLASIGVQVAVSEPTGSDTGTFCARLRAELDERLRTGRARVASLIALVPVVEEAVTASRNLVDAQKRLEETSGRLLRERRDEGDREAEALGRRGRLQSLEKHRSVLLERQRASDRLNALSARRRQLADDMGTHQRLVEDAAAKADSVREATRVLNEESDALAPRLASITDELRAAQIRLEALHSLKSTVSAVPSTAATGPSADADVHTLSQSVAEIKATVSAKRNEVERIETEIARIEAEMRALADGRDAVMALVAQLRNHVQGDTCLLCGHRHATRDHLLSAIDAHVHAVPRAISSTADELAKQREALLQASAAFESGQLQLAHTEQRLASAVTALEERRAQVRRVERMALDAAVSPTPDSIDEAILAAQERVQALRASTARVEGERAQLVDRLRVAEGEQAEINSRRRSVQSRLDELVLSANETERELAAMLGPGPNQPTDAADTIGAAAPLDMGLSEVTTAIDDQQRALASAEVELRNCRDRREQTEATIRECDREIARIQGTLEQCRLAFRSSGFDEIPDNEVLRRTNQTEGGRLTETEKAAAVVASYESAVRRQVAATERDELRRQHATAVEERLQVEERLGRLNEVSTTIAGWVESLREKTAFAVHSFVRKHEPDIARLFKAMIPWPFAFESLAMMPDDVGVDLGIRYRGASLCAGEPRYFLSSAQANVLALSIFLSLSTRQTWSPMETMLLDDPVQHLDDLDAVALLDNVRAIALGHLGHRKQVILSTCDRNLYLLILRKFSLLPPEKLRFTGISLVNSGGKTPEIHYDFGGPDARVVRSRNAG